MVFSSSIFLFLFLPIVILIYYISPKKIKNYILLIFSLIFYIFGGTKYIFILIGVVLINYLGALLIDKYRSKSKLILIISLILNLGILIYFKYFDFLISNFNILFNKDISLMNIALPIGISFYTFQAIGYLVDVYRKEVSVQKNFFYLLLYVSFFPQLVAGPIVRYKTIEKEMYERKTNIDEVSYGTERFIIGLGKKLIIANQVGALADIVFSLESVSMPVAWLGAFAFFFQIYFDFSAYSDMAIGLGRIFGFHFLENFNYPYISASITEFWRRWHISLSSFFRDYVYIPLGGNRVKKSKWIFNLLVVWLLTGLWHGASWNFVLWGLYYFIFLLIEKLFLNNFLNKHKILSHIYTLLIVLFGWVLFNTSDLNSFLIMIKSMFSFNLGEINEFYIYLESYGFYLILALLFSLPIYPRVEKKFKDKVYYNIIKYIALILIFIVSIMFLAKSSYNPFIYFRF